MLVAKGRPASLTIEVRNYDGVLAAATGNVVVTVKDIDNTTVGTGNASASPTAGVYTYAIPSAVTDSLGVYEATATYTLSGAPVTRVYSVETVNDYLFEIHELRDRDRALENSTNYPAERIRQARDEATADLERSAEVAFATRSTRQILSGNGTSRLLLPHLEVSAIIGVTLYDEDTGVDSSDDLTGTDLQDVEVDREAGVLIRTDGQVFPLGSNNVIVDYEHGYELPPAPVRQAAMTLAEEYLVPSGLPARATSQSTDLGNFRISVANEDLNRPTGIPSVDAVIAKFGRRRPRIG